ncbi:type II toxin-antitoxin system ParD family antitoxin [Roseateles sp. LYH14W]|uniref:Type II toxin-antitoxin system ParD family antitoxin n=1 Tax=Pelomonas parva TaxID=3299032 RepID=A0ABW7FDF8_9BURK
MGINVNLTPQLEDLIRAQVASGRYASASEVVGVALRLLDERDRVQQLGLDDLRRDVRAGLDSGASEAWNAGALKTNSRSRRSMRSMVE